MNSFGLFGMSPKDRSRMRRLQRELTQAQIDVVEANDRFMDMSTSAKTLTMQRDTAMKEFESCKQYLVSSEESRQSVERRASGLEMTDDAARKTIALLKGRAVTLEEELFEFGDHKPGCAILRPHTLFQVLGQSEPPEPPKCDCGWQAVHDARTMETDG